MTNYEDICKLYSQSRESYFASRESAGKFAGSFFARFSEFLDLPEPSKETEPLIYFKSNDPEKKENFFPTPFGAVFLNKDGVWQFSVVIRLHMNASPNTYPYEMFVINVYLRLSKDMVFYKIDPNYEEFAVDSDKVDGHLLTVCFPRIKEWITDFYQKRIRYYSESESQEITVGLSLRSE